MFNIYGYLDKRKIKTPNINCKICQKFNVCVKVKNPKSCESYRENEVETNETNKV